MTGEKLTGSVAKKNTALYSEIMLHRTIDYVNSSRTPIVIIRFPRHILVVILGQNCARIPALLTEVLSRN
jgi:hypothetical protein